MSNIKKDCNYNRNVKQKKKSVERSLTENSNKTHDKTSIQNSQWQEFYSLLLTEHKYP